MKTNKMCEGCLVPWEHMGPVEHYQLYDADGAPDIKAHYCIRCVKDDLSRGYDWRLIEETPK